MRHRPRALHIPLGLALGLSAAACASSPAARGPEPDAEVRVDRMVPQNRSLDEATVEVKLEVANPKSTAIEIRAVEYEVDTGDVAGVVRGSSEGGGVLEAGQRAEVAFIQSLAFPEDPAAYRALVERGAFPVTLRGAVKLADGAALAFERPGEVVTPLLPKFVVHDAQAAQYGKSGLDVTFFLRLINENVFPITIDAVSYTLLIEGQEIKTEQGGIGTRLVGGAVQEFEVNTTITDKSPPELRAVLKSRRLRYQVKGQVSLSELELPFELGGEINLAESSGE